METITQTREPSLTADTVYGSFPDHWHIFSRKKGKGEFLRATHCCSWHMVDQKERVAQMARWDTMATEVNNKRNQYLNYKTMTGSHSLLTTKFLIQVHNQICFFDCTHIWVSFSDILLLTIIVNGQLSPKISFHQECKNWHMSKLQVSPPMQTSIQNGEPRNKYFRYFSQSLIYKNRKTKECSENFGFKREVKSKYFLLNIWLFSKSNVFRLIPLLYVPLPPWFSPHGLGSTILVSCRKADLKLISEYKKVQQKNVKWQKKNISMQLILKGKNTKIKIWCMCSKKATPLKTNFSKMDKHSIPLSSQVFKNKKT